MLAAHDATRSCARSPADDTGRAGQPHGRGAIPAVTFDNADGMRQAVAHLVGARPPADRLRRRTAHVLVQPRTAARACARRRRRPASSWSELGNFAPTFDGGVAAADRAVAAGVTAVVAYNDLVALGLLTPVARARRRRCPAEISVVGFDDIADVARWSTPR